MADVNEVLVGELVRTTRQRLGISNAELARRINMKPSSVIGLYDRPDVHAKQLYQIGQALGADMLQLLRMALMAPANLLASSEEFDLEILLKDYSELQKRCLQLDEKCADLKQINELQSELLRQCRADLVDAKKQIQKENAIKH